MEQPAGTPGTVVVTGASSGIGLAIARLFVRDGCDVLMLMVARDEARLAYAGLMSGKRLVIPGVRNKLLVQSLRVSPRTAVQEVVRRLQE